MALLDRADRSDARLAGTSQRDAVPAKRRPGCANFALDEPALKLVLIENPSEARSTTTWPLPRRGCRSDPQCPLDSTNQERTFGLARFAETAYVVDVYAQ